MRHFHRLCAPGLFRRSLDEFKRFAKIAVRLEGITVPSKPYVLLDFADATTTTACKTMSDADIGGFSTANLKFIPATATEPAHARFNGCISTKLPVDRPQVHRTGYAAFRSQDRLATIFGRSFWDIDPYAYLALRVKSDGRKYHINVQSETIVPTDIHQHRLYVRQPGKWETVFLRWNDFVRTNHGAVVEPQNELLRQKIRTIGIGLIDRVPGPFDISVSRIWATNVPGETPGSALEHGERFESKPQGNSASAVNAMACNQ